MRRLAIAAVPLLALAGSVGACKTPRQEEPLRLQPEAMEQRVRETRRFDAGDEIKLLRAALIILQDEGYQLTEMDADLGVVAGSRPGWGRPTAVSVVSRPVGAPAHSVAIRVTFHGIHTTWSWSEGAKSGLRRFTDSALYQAFFDRLSKAVFVEARSL